MNPGVPDRKSCIELMDRQAMLPHIRAHSFAVCDVACRLARALMRCAPGYDLAEIEAAALLHDITKTRSLHTGENHARTGAALLEDMGYSRIAPMVRAHVLPPDAGNGVSPEEIVSYADKRVLHDAVVCLEERFSYLVARYGTDSSALARIDAARRRAHHIEEKILQLTGTDVLGRPAEFLSLSS